MGFREFVKQYESGLMMTAGWPGASPPKNVDMYLHQYGQTGATQGMFAGSGPGLGNQQVKRMKKMKK